MQAATVAHLVMQLAVLTNACNRGGGKMADETDWHAKGQKDYAEGRYEQPVGPIHLLLSSDADRDIQRNKEYDAGYGNAKKQS